KLGVSINSNSISMLGYGARLQIVGLSTSNLKAIFDVNGNNIKIEGFHIDGYQPELEQNSGIFVRVFGEHCEFKNLTITNVHAYGIYVRPEAAMTRVTNVHVENVSGRDGIRLD